MPVVLAITWLTYTADANYDKLNKLEKRIQSATIQKQGVNQFIQSWQHKKRLPLLEGRLEYAQLYFGLYDLNLTIEDKIRPATVFIKTLLLMVKRLVFY